MKAIVLAQPGDTGQFATQEIARPAIQSNEVLIQTKAISINPIDAKTRAGKGIYGRLKDQGPLILGWDISGIVTETKSDKFKPGNEVFGMINFPAQGKAYAEYVAAPDSQLALKPANISHEEAAASTLCPLTAWQAMTQQAKVQPGQKVLIHAAAGGVGHYAVQIAKYLGAHVTGTSSAANKDFVLYLGADEHIDYSGYDWEKHGAAFDFILDTVGGDNVEKSLLAVKKGGTVISIASAVSADVNEGARAEGIHAAFMLVQPSGEDMQRIAALLRENVIHAHVTKSYPFSELAAAHLQIESGHTIGKIVISL